MPHPFNGKWKSYAVNPFTDKTYKDGKIDLTIEDDGTYVRGWHIKGSKRNPLDPIGRPTATKIKVKERNSPFCTYDGLIRIDLSTTDQSVLIGTYVIPETLARKTRKRSKKIFGQNDGIWVGTKP